MKYINYLVVLAVVLFFSHSAAAQPEAEPAAQEEAGLTIAPVDIFVCNYRKGQNRSSLDRVIANWNAWMDSSNAAPYSAWTYVADYNSPDYSFDIAWLGAWPDGTTMGQSHDQWMAEGGEQRKAFDKVLKCDLHANFASYQVRSGGVENTDQGILEFTDCTIREGNNMDDAMAAIDTWSEYWVARGSKSSEWVFFPVYGGDADFDFKILTAYHNYTDLGVDYDRYGTGGGYLKARETLGSAIDCGVGRTYVTKRERDGSPKPAPTE